MKRHLRLLLVISSLLLFGKGAFAEFEQGKNALLVNFGFTKGGLGLGLDYEYGYDRTYGIGGYFRMYPHENANNSSTYDPGYPGINAVGAFIRPHFSRQNWDFYLSPGFGFMSYEPVQTNVSTKTLIGPSLGIGLLYEINTSVSAGIEDMLLVSWFGDAAFRGVNSNEIMAKFRFIFK